jgi:hypothetical protein
MNYNVGRVKPSNPEVCKPPVTQKHLYTFFHQGLTPTDVISRRHSTGNVYRKVKSVEVSWEQEGV